MKHIFTLIACMFVFAAAQAQTDTTATDSVPPYYKYVEEMPAFPGGDMGLMKYMMVGYKYPEEAKQAGAKGDVYVWFLIDEEGAVTDAVIDTPACTTKHPLLMQEALRHITEMPKWTPGVHHGKTVKVEMTKAVRFRY